MKIDKKYKKYGLKTVIVHPPEWEFEKSSKNILYAIKKYKIKTPIIVDRNKKIIKKLKINFWPAQILLKNKKVLYKHAGEGNYKELENLIFKNLELKAKKIFDKEPKYSRFPTIYAGKRKKGSIKKAGNKLKIGIIYKNGKWAQEDEFVKSIGSNNSLTILAKGRLVRFVAKSLTKKPIKVFIALNNKYVKKINIKKPQLYSILALKKNEPQKLTLTSAKNLAVYSFSFQ